MSCAHPLSIYNEYLGKYVKIPCNRCICCRVDKRNMWSDRCNYAYKKFNFIGAFVTFTFDDFHLFDPSLTGSIHITDSAFSPDGKSYVTLAKSDLKNLIARIRSYMDYHNINSDNLRRDFKYLAVGEYGSSENSTVGYGRPHYHVLFFGLDFATAKSLFEKCWPSGIVDCRPILDGGIDYVLKYLDKQLYDDQKFDTYDYYHIQAPFKTQSPSLGSDIYLDAILSGFASSHNLTYNVNPKINRPIPSYYLKKYTSWKTQSIRDSFALPENVSSYNSAHSSSDQIVYNGIVYNFNKNLRDFNQLRSLAREKILTKYCRERGVPMNDPDSFSYLDFSKKYRVLNSDLPRVPNNYNLLLEVMKND